MSFTVYGNPVPKARPRVISKGGRTWSFTPKKSAEWEKKVSMEARKHFETPTDNPVELFLEFYLKTPKSKMNKLFVQTIPDLDNLEKSILDALNGVAYKDDRLVVSKYSTKYYSNTDKPRVVITVKEIDYDD